MLPPGSNEGVTTERITVKSETAPSSQSGGNQPTQVDATSTKRTGDEESAKENITVKQAPTPCRVEKSGRVVGVPTFKAPPIGKAKSEAVITKPIAKASPPPLESDEEEPPLHHQHHIQKTIQRKPKFQV